MDSEHYKSSKALQSLECIHIKSVNETYVMIDSHFLLNVLSYQLAKLQPITFIPELPFVNGGTDPFSVLFCKQNRFYGSLSIPGLKYV